MASTEDSVLESVQEYYGKILKTSSDLKTNVCKTACNKMPAHVLDALKKVHEEVNTRYYGCGLVIPECLDGASVLDLGCGTGRDCYIISQLVGENGHVTGIDMTDEQLQVANQYVSWHMEKFGYTKPNIKFLKGYIETLGSAGVQPDSYDVIVSNCVVNLSPNKEAVLREAFKALKPGGELYFSDVYCNQDLAAHVRKNQILWGECIGGALYWKDLVKIAMECGFSCPRLINASEIQIEQQELQEVLGLARFVSATYRLFKLPHDRKEECVVTYDGKLAGSHQTFEMDHMTKFIAGEKREVDAELSSILLLSRFNKHFKFSPSTGMEVCITYI
ncbi:arsenite methyltransferase-like isoform X2 [Tubulanus polymorphus]|uniref:arsenite methyltransferase-like isoform X2 n=1 Tax=Tubulanus polymorphus TaxID=672921 RepID=UPI003DA4144D